MSRGEEKANPYESPQCEPDASNRKRIDVTKPLSPWAVLAIGGTGTFVVIAVPLSLGSPRPLFVIIFCAGCAVVIGILMFGFALLVKKLRIE